MRKLTKINILLGVVIPVLILLLWEILVNKGILPKESISSPSNAFIEFWDLVFTNYLWKHVGYSLLRLFSGFLFGGLFGIILGWMVGYYRVSSKLLEPSILTFIPIPPMAWIPFLIALFGISDLTKILLISIGSFSVLFISTSEGVRNSNRKLLEMASVFGKSQKEITRSIIFPSVLKYILGNIRIAMALSFTLLLAAEMINATSGLGWLINDARRFSRAPEMIVGIGIIGILGKTIDYAIVKYSNYLLRWDVSLRSETFKQ